MEAVKYAMGIAVPMAYGEPGLVDGAAQEASASWTPDDMAIVPTDSSKEAADRSQTVSCVPMPPSYSPKQVIKAAPVRQHPPVVKVEPDAEPVGTPQPPAESAGCMAWVSLGKRCRIRRHNQGSGLVGYATTWGLDAMELQSIEEGEVDPTEYAKMIGVL